jgi:uncharacterized protein DUF4190
MSHPSPPPFDPTQPDGRPPFDPTQPTTPFPAPDSAAPAGPYPPAAGYPPPENTGYPPPDYTGYPQPPDSAPPTAPFPPAAGYPGSESAQFPPQPYSGPPGPGYPPPGYPQSGPPGPGYPPPGYPQSGPPGPDYAPPGYPQAGYPQSPGGYPPPPMYQPVLVGHMGPPTSGWSVAAMVLGIVGLLIFWCAWGIPSLLAVIFGHIGLAETKHGRKSGRGMAITGLVLGYIFIGPAILIAIAGGIGSLGLLSSTP